MFENVVAYFGIVAESWNWTLSVWVLVAEELVGFVEVEVLG